MRNYPEFNFPNFHRCAKVLRNLGHEVFSPAEKDEEVNGEGFSKIFTTGNLKEAENLGFSLRQALGYDLEWICKEADGIFMMKGWENSYGAVAEWATARALGLEFFYE